MTTFRQISQPSDAQGLLDFDYLLDDASQLKIQLRSAAARCFELCFCDHLLYQKVDEGDALATVEEIKAQGLLGQSLYEAEHSSLVEIFVARSRETRRNQAIRHFVVLTNEDVIDILAISPPAITSLREGHGLAL